MRRNADDLELPSTSEGMRQSDEEETKLRNYISESRERIELMERKLLILERAIGRREVELQNIDLTTASSQQRPISRIPRTVAAAEVTHIAQNILGISHLDPQCS